eukprot:gene14195-19048_t
MAAYTVRSLITQLTRQPLCTNYVQQQKFTRFGQVTSSRINNYRLFSSSSHQSNSVELDQSYQQIIEKIKLHQQNVPRLSMAEEVRTLIDQSIGYGVLSTNSIQYDGFPTGSVVGFELDSNGKPFFVFSSMSAHTKDVMIDKKVSLTVTANNFKGAAEGRVVIIGKIEKVVDPSLIASLREKYLNRHKDAYWIDFGDFSYFTMESIVGVRFVGGFAMAGSITPEEYETAKPDPVAPFANPVMKHMNDDHSDSVVQMIKHYVGVECSGAEIVSLDSLGMTVKAKISDNYAKIRLPFPRPAKERKSIKEVLVEMTRASAPSPAE